MTQSRKIAVAMNNKPRNQAPFGVELKNKISLFLLFK
jgi:hypothetical protein